MSGYGAPSPARGVFGRGRIGMQGPGGRMPGRMPMGRGGGRGRAGRVPHGAMRFQQQQMRVQQLRKQRVPNELDTFNRYVMYKVTSFLDRDDQENLGRAFPQFTPNPLTPQQQQMRMMKKMHDLKLQNGGDDSTSAASTSAADDDATLASVQSQDVVDPNQDVPVNAEDAPAEMEDSAADNGGEEEKTEDQAEPKQDAPESKDVDDEKKDDSQEESKQPENQLTPEQKKELMLKREEQIRMNMTDCHTLLAQLNTKRLFRRIKYFKQKDPNIDIDILYPYHATTDQISEIEWYELVEDYKARFDAKIAKKKAEEAAKAERKANKPKRNNRSKKNKKKKGKGRGRGKRSNNKNKNKQQVEEEEDLKAEEDSEDDGSEEDESDVDDEKETEKEVADEEKETEKEGGDDIDDDDSSLGSLLDPKYKYIGDKPSTTELLMFTPCPRAVAVLASYPRSGNSLMRNLYEKITLRVTGSDMMGGLQKHDLVGEMATGTNDVQFVKTHYPERMGHPPIEVNRAVLLVRNPYDALDSYFNLMSTSTHTSSLSPEARKKYEKVFAEMAKKEILVWRDFHEYWLKQKIPLLVVRYEDLIRNTLTVIGKVLKFVLEVKDMTFFEDRIIRAIGEQQIENLGPYKARSGGIGKSLTKGIYTPQLLSQINWGIAGTMEKFGYKEMLVPNPKKWKLAPLDQWGVFIPGTSDEPLVINQKGLVRGPNRQTNWRQVKMMVEQDKRAAENGTDNETPKTVDLN